MSAGARIAARYRGASSAKLREMRPNIRNPRCVAAIDIVLTERQDAYQVAFDATQTVFDATGGAHAAELHASALGTSMRYADLGEWLEAERAMAVADALWDYLRERSDT